MNIPLPAFGLAKELLSVFAIYLLAFLAISGALVLLAFLVMSKRKGAFLQAVYLLRYPLIFALILISFPLIAISFESGMMGNLFIFDNIWPIILATLLAILVAWTVMYTIFLVLNALAELYELPDYITELGTKLGSSWVAKYRVWLFALLAAPVAVVSVVKAEVSHPPFGINQTGWATTGVVIGVLVAWGLYWLSIRLQANQRVLAILDGLADGVAKILDFLKAPKSARKGFGYRSVTGFRHETATIFFVILAILYGAGAFLFYPDQHRVVVPPAPAAVYLLSLLLILTWAFSGLAHIVDRYRVPTSLLLLLVVIIAASLGDTHHYYQITPRQSAATAQDQVTAGQGKCRAQEAPPALSVQQASEITESPGSFTATIPSPVTIFDARQFNQASQQPVASEQPTSTVASQSPGGPQPLVIIMASGGGIKSAVWTSKVLTGLQHTLGPQFANAIGLISAVSGGAVGTMYYVDGFTCAGPPPEKNLDKIVTMASESSVEQAAWGLVYPDLWRTFAAGWGVLGNRFADRSWAMEAAWQGRLQELAKLDNKARDLELAQGLYAGESFTETHVPEGTRMLSDWQAGVTAGWRPATIFGATEAETGARFLFATANIPVTWTTRSFYNAFPGYDLPVATAARMAATFPYVSPLASAYLSKNDQEIIAGRLGFTTTEMLENWNLADGGYFDNDGVVTALQWLEMILASKDDETRPRHVVLIQLLASQRATSVERCDATKAEQAGDATDMYSEVDALQTQKKPSIAPSWVDEFFGPILTLLSTWGTSQVERGQNEIDHFIDLKRREYPDLSVLYCTFDLRDSDVLSWQLAPSELTTILNAYADERIQRRVEQIQKFLEDSNR